VGAERARAKCVAGHQALRKVGQRIRSRVGRPSGRHQRVGRGSLAWATTGRARLRAARTQAVISKTDARPTVHLSPRAQTGPTTGPDTDA
jgi:hypothetical protein